MPTPFEDFFRNVPTITRAYMTVCVLTTLMVHLEFINPYTLYFNFNRIVYEFEVWRIVTTFLFFGFFGLNFIFHMFFLVRHSWDLEDQIYRGRTADYLFMWLVCGTLLLLINCVMHYFRAPMMFLAPSLAFSVVYIWGRKNPNLMLNFLGLFHFTAPYLAYVILAFGLLLGQSPVQDLLGIAVGHVYYYFEDVYPKVRHRRVLATPAFLKAMFDE